MTIPIAITPTSTMDKNSRCYVSLPHIWGVLSRKRQMNPSTKHRPPKRTKRGFFGQLDRKLFYFVYQGLGITAPFLLCYVVGLTVEGIAGDKFVLSLIIAVVTSLLTGLCHYELITASHECSGSIGTAVYQLVGEFPAYWAAVLSCFAASSSLAAMTKALSSTMDELSHGGINNFISEAFGVLSFSGLPPDMVAFGAALVTSVILACGLQQAGVLRTAMNCLSLVALFLSVSVGAVILKRNPSKQDPKLHWENTQILAGAGVFCVMFSQFLELGRRSKKQQATLLNLHMAMGLSSLVVLVASLALGIVLSLFLIWREPISTAIFVKILRLKELEWAFLSLGLIQIVICGLGISEAGELFGRQLVTMASDGFIPSYLSKESSRSFSHSRAQLFGGLASSILALLMTPLYLLKFLAANVLLLNIIIVVVTLYRPFRCTYDTICSVAVTPSSKTQKYKERRRSSSKYLLPKNYQKAGQNTINFLKNGFRSLKHNDLNLSNDDNKKEDEIPLLSSLFSANEAAEEIQKSDEIQGSLESINCNNVSLQFSSTVEEEEGINDICEVNSRGTGDNGSGYDIVQENTYIELRSMRGLGTTDLEHNQDDSDDFIEEEDIDAIISDYKEQLRISSSGTNVKLYPTKTTARVALFCILALIILSTLFSTYALRNISNQNTPKLTSILQALFTLLILFLMIGILIIITRLPKLMQNSSKNNKCHFKSFTTMSCFALFMNILLFIEVVAEVKWIALSFYAVALIWYGCYGVKNSAATNSQFQVTHMIQREETPNEIIQVASPIFPASTYTVQPQACRLNRNI